MRENEKALLLLSTGKDAQPKKVDVEVPPPEGDASGQGGGSGSSGSSGSSGETGGEAGGESGGAGGEAGRKLDDLLRGARQGAEGIPDEIKELIQMIPT
jgi:hypothetical protein